MSVRFVWLIGLLLLWLGCGGTLEQGSLRAVLVPIDTIHLQEPDTLFLGEFRSVAVTLNPFRLYVPDRRLRRVIAYDKTGQPVQVIGHPGFEEPGALLGPLYVSILDNRIYVQEIYNRIVVFDKQGNFLFHKRMPDHYYPEFPIRFLNDQVIIASTNLQEPCTDPLLKPCQETRTISVLDTSFKQVKDRFGVYPQVYFEHNLAVRAPRIDVNSSGIVGVGYSLAPEIQFYALSDLGNIFLLKSVSIQHPSWHSPKNDISAKLALNNRKKWETLMLRTSQLFEVFFVADTLLLAYFVNKRPDYYRTRGWDDTKIEPLGVLVSVSGRWQQALALPGPVLGRDEAFHLYIRLSDEPDRRLIGRFRVEVRR